MGGERNRTADRGRSVAVAVLIALCLAPPISAAADPPGEPAASTRPSDAGAVQPTAASDPAAEPAAPLRVLVRTGQHRGFSRVVFDWPVRVGYRVERQAGDSVVMVFDRIAVVDDRSLGNRTLRYVRGGGVTVDGEETRVVLRVDPASSLRDYTEGRKVVVDIAAPVAAAAPPTVPAPPAAEPAPLPATPAASTPPAATAAPAPVASPAAPPPSTPAPVATLAPPPAPPSPSPPAPAPPPSPPASSTAPAAVVGEAVLPFRWPAPTAAAVFRRAETLWVVFDAATTLDSRTLQQRAGPLAPAIEQVPHPSATVLRLTTASGVEPRLERDGTAWLLRLRAGADADAPGQPIVPNPAPEASGGARLLLPADAPSRPIAVADPEVGDTFVVVPLPVLGSGLARTHGYRQFRLPASLQGVAVEPLIDTLRVRSLRDAVELSSSDGLHISPVTAAQQAGSRLAAAEEPTRLLDAGDWGSGDLVGFAVRKRALERAIVDADEDRREPARLRLAQALLGVRFGAEASGVLDLAERQRPTIAGEPAFLLLRGIARLLQGRSSEASADLAAAAAGGSDEATLWSALAGTAAGRPPASMTPLPRWIGIVLSYPQGLRTVATPLLAEAAIASGRLQDAESVLELARTDAQTTADRSRIAFVDGRRKEAAGDVEGALASWAEAAELDPRLGRARAEFARVQLLRRKGRMTEAEAAQALDALRFVWRGDELEFRILRELGRSQIAAGDAPNGLRTLKRAAGEFRTLPEATEIPREMATAFERLYLDGAADRLPAVTALGLFDEFQELTPPGERGAAMTRRLAERLVEVDLLDRAAGLYERQLAAAGAPADRAAIGLRLAEIRTLDHQPEAALDALARTGAAGLPAELQRKRRLAEARALAALGRSDAALAALGGDDGLDAHLVRAAAQRRQGDWAGAAASLRRVVEAVRASPSAPLTEQQARDVLDLAVATSLAGSDTSLAQLDAEWGPTMDATPLKDAFRMIAGSTPPPEADARALAELVERAMAFRRSTTSAPPPTAPPGPPAAP